MENFMSPEVRAARDEIAAACPDVKFEYLDYGRSLYGYKHGPDGGMLRASYRTIMQCERPSVPNSGFGGQDKIEADLDDLIKFWRDF